MATCDPNELIAAGKCFSLSCISRDNQIVAELELLRRWAGFTGTVQELLTAGRCFSRSCLSEDSQIVAELQLLCDIANAAPVVCFTLDMSSTPDTGANDGTATATPVGGVGPFTYLWSDAQTTQTAVGLAGDIEYTVQVTDTGSPTCIVDGAVAVGMALQESVATTNETVTSGVGNGDGTITITVTGGVGPYTIHGVSGLGDQSGPGPDFVYTGLAGANDYTFWIEDSVGNTLPTDYPSSVITQHVNRDAFDWNYVVGGVTKSTTPFVGAVSFDITSSVFQFNALLMTISPSSVLTSVDFRVDSFSLANNYTVANSAAPTSHHYVVTLDPVAIAFNSDSIDRVTFSITRPTVTGNTTTATANVLGGASTNVGPFTANWSDAPTLAAYTGNGHVTSAVTIALPVVNKTGSDAQITAVAINKTYGFVNIGVTYNYHCPEE